VIKAVAAAGKEVPNQKGQKKSAKASQPAGRLSGPGFERGFTVYARQFVEASPPIARSGRRERKPEEASEEPSKRVESYHFCLFLVEIEV
jgi:hypothetical protein